MKKKPSEKSKAPTQGTHPETGPQRSKTGAPGSESSKAPSRAKDVRNAHDKDGNAEQSGR